MKRITYTVLAAALLMSGPAMANSEFQHGKHGRFNYAYGTSQDYDYRQLIHLNGNDIAKIQRALRAEGFNPGPIDGIFGWRTERALTAYQDEHDLQGDGNVTARTLKALKVAIADEDKRVLRAFR